MRASHAFHRDTPTLAVIDPRGHRVRSVSYRRIFLNTDARGALDEVDMAETFIHEATHLLFGTQDILYGEGMRQTRPSARTAIDVIGRYGRRAHVLGEWAPPVPAQADRPAAEQRVIQPMGGEAAYTRASDLERRTKMHLRNADTLATLFMIYGARGVERVAHVAAPTSRLSNVREMGARFGR